MRWHSWLIAQCGCALVGLLPLLVTAAPLEAPPARGGAAPYVIDTAPAAKTAALLDFDRLPLGALLEAKLTGSAGLDWLDRNEIDEILREQKLQALFSPEGAAARASLGKLLKADLLVMVRKAEPAGQEGEPNQAAAASPARVQLIVAETRRGIRLLTREIQPSKDVTADVTLLRGFVEHAIVKQRQNSQEIFAVPPFVSHDLGFRYDYLKSTFSKLLEELLLDRPGAVVVELAEAQALAKEVALASDQTRLERELPIYVLGDYRHEGQDSTRTISVKLKLMRGEQLLGTETAAGLPPAQASGFLLQSLTQLIGKLKTQALHVPDPRAEARQLAQRSREFQQIGNWPEALALVEASLLIDPDQEELHRNAVILLGKLTQPYRWAGAPEQKRVALATAFYRRGLEHLQEFFKSAKSLNQYPGGNDFLQEFRSAWNAWGAPEQATPDVRKMKLEFEREQREILWQLARLRARTQFTDDTSFMNWSLQGLTEQEKYDALLKMLIELRDIPGLRQRVVAYAQHGYTVGVLDTPAGEQFLKQLSLLPEPDFQESAKDLQLRLRKARIEEAARVAALKSASASAPVAHHFQPVQFHWTDSSGKHGTFASSVACWPAGEGVDVVFAGPHLHLMKQPGQLQRIWTNYALAPWSFPSVFYDGQFIWAAYERPNDSPVLLVIDPVKEQVREIGEAEGLPSSKNLPQERTRRFLRASPLGKGQVCVAGSFGQLWLATVSLAADGSPTVRVFHEGRLALNREDKEQWKDTHVACQPAFMFTLSEDADGRQQGKRVVIGRKGLGDVSGHPLLVDPESLQVEVMQDYLSGDAQLQVFDVSRGAVYFVGAAPQPLQELRVKRVEYPGRVRDAFAIKVPEGWVAIHHDRLNIFGKQHWTVDSQYPAVHVESEVPWYYWNHWAASPREPLGRVTAEGEQRLDRISHSNHFGLLFHVTTSGGAPTTYRIAPSTGEPRAEDP